MYDLLGYRDKNYLSCNKELLSPVVRNTLQDVKGTLSKAKRYAFDPDSACYVSPGPDAILK